MPFIDYGDVCSCLLIWKVSHLLNGWPHDHGPTNVEAIEKLNEDNYIEAEYNKLQKTRAETAPTMAYSDS